MLLHSVVPFAIDLLVPAALRLRGLLSSAGSRLKLRGVNKILIKQRVLKGFYLESVGNVITILVNCALASVCFVVVLYNIISSQTEQAGAEPRRRVPRSSSSPSLSLSRLGEALHTPGL